MSNTSKKRKSVATYMAALFAIALLLLLLAYFMQERAYAAQENLEYNVSCETWMEDKVDQYVRH